MCKSMHNPPSQAFCPQPGPVGGLTNVGAGIVYSDMSASYSLRPKRKTNNRFFRNRSTVRHHEVHSTTSRYIANPRPPPGHGDAHSASGGSSTVTGNGAVRTHMDDLDYRQLRYYALTVHAVPLVCARVNFSGTPRKPGRILWRRQSHQRLLLLVVGSFSTDYCSEHLSFRPGSPTAIPSPVVPSVTPHLHRRPQNTSYQRPQAYFSG
jgi:hypothetical protein